MSFLDSTMETEKEKESLKELMIKTEGGCPLPGMYASKLYLYGEKLNLAKHSRILPYAPNEINILNENYKFCGKKIYMESLAATVVYKGIDKLTQSPVAIKEVRKEKLKSIFMQEMAKNELTIHSSISKICDNIVSVKDYFEDEKAYYLVMEYSEEPNYFEDLLDNRYCPIADENTLKAFAFDILSGLKEIHAQNVIHCDIKPQNFLLFKNLEENLKENVERNLEGDLEENLEESSIISLNPNEHVLKISDFGLSHIIPEGSDKAFMKFPCGTFAYTAPEVGKNCYVDKSIDIWSFGVCLYQMAVAYFPTAIKQYKYGINPIPFRTCDWSSFDFPKIKNLIESCLQIDPSKRITVEDALNHPWFDE